MLVLLLCDRSLRNQSVMQKVSFPQATSLTASTVTTIKIHRLLLSVGRRLNTKQSRLGSRMKHYTIANKF